MIVVSSIKKGDKFRITTNDSITKVLTVEMENDNLVGFMLETTTSDGKVGITPMSIEFFLDRIDRFKPFVDGPDYSCPIQDLQNGKYEWFKCECGNDKFHITKTYSEPGEPQLGAVEKHFNCSCGQSYIWEYGEVRHTVENQ